MANSFQSFLNTYAKKDKKITQKDIKDYASKGGSKEKVQAWIDKINRGTKATKGIKVGGNVNVKDSFFKSSAPKPAPKPKPKPSSGSKPKPSSGSILDKYLGAIGTSSSYTPLKDTSPATPSAPELTVTPTVPAASAAPVTPSAPAASAAPQNDAYTAYVDRYPDLKRAFKNLAHGQSKSEFGRTHWESSGKKEGRALSSGGGSSTSTPTGGSSGYSDTDIDLGRYEKIAGIDYTYKNLLQTDRLNNDIIINGLNNDARKYLKQIDQAIATYGEDAATQRQEIASKSEERWRKYMADQERAASENVATIRGEYSLDLQEIVNAGLKDVETVRGEYSIQSDKIRGEYGLESERIKGATARDVAQRQKEATIFGGLMQGFW